jgi:hypothetical protein
VSDIFISYARGDRDKAQLLAHAFQHHGWTVWWDREIVPGSVFERTIEEAIDNARCMIVLWSQKAVASDWVRAEMEEGRQRGIVIPTRLDNAQFPLPIRQIQSCGLSAWHGGVDGEGIEELLQAVKYVTTRPASSDGRRSADLPRPAPGSGAATAPQRHRRTPIMLSIVALLGVSALLSIAAAIVWMPKVSGTAAPAATSTSPAGKVAVSLGLYE